VGILLRHNAARIIISGRTDIQTIFAVTGLLIVGLVLKVIVRSIKLGEYNQYINK